MFLENLGNFGGGVLPNSISDKKYHLPHPFFRPGLKNRGLFSDLKLLWLERQQKDFLKFISNSHIVILSMSVGIEAIDSSLRFRSSLEKLNPIPDQNVQSLYPFSDPYPFGCYLYLCGLYKGVPPPPGMTLNLLILLSKVTVRTLSILEWKFSKWAISVCNYLQLSRA